ncbi:Protein of unknown function (DUF2721) [Spongiibacter sp. IMCC21906]|jgi:hypothetical protein|uniref:DUF2721 domain-containing protein n=1 Tax=Spongiibacter sp. IMCC21906 TaxID=1620392 RepID=UPI00062DE54B|nr:DUF2721 domain-containing protein [Spongiibacter sp. IMCC21906]AKH70245.1 Protein of unknown function (DUF2721) [Spongiibacter sp. IMCC21906]
MAADIAVMAITHAIQQAVAPVFLLAGVGAILNVLANRLSRIVDRSRTLHARLETADDPRRQGIDRELAVLVRRGRVVHRAIGFATTSALLVCIVIATLFISAVAEWNSGLMVAALFVLAMLFLISALIGFLREIQLATRVILNGP